MTIRNLIIAALLVALAPAVAQSATPSPAPQPALDRARLDAAHRLIERLLPAEEREAIFAAMLNSTMGSMAAGVVDAQPGLRDAFERIPELKPVFARFVERQQSLALADLRETTPELIHAYATAYARRFTTDELVELERFFATDLGAKFARHSNEIMADPAIQSWQRNIVAVAQARQEEELGRFLEEIMPVIQAAQEEAPDAL